MDQQSNPIAFPDAQRKCVTALFSDLSGYTVMTEKLDPEEVKEITSTIFDGIREAVSKYEGFIERFAGDSVLAIFGIPKAYEDHSIRAIHAAMEIHAFVDSLGPHYKSMVGQYLSMHSGINTGIAVTADVEPEKGTPGVTGEAINVAARLSDRASSGEILIGPNTYRLSKRVFAFQALGPIKIRGKTESIPIYKLLSANTFASFARVGREVSSEMLGRDLEMARLESQVMKAINGEGSVVNVIGEAGIGKSRLIAELRKREVMKRVTLLEGRAISIGKNLNFHPIIDLLKQWARIVEDDSESEAFDKLENAVRAVHPEKTDEILPFIATLMGMKLSGKHAERVKGIEGESLEIMILKNIRDVLVKASDLTPLVIVFEDLHWTDTSSLELLISLFRLAETHKIVFVNVFRPGHKETGDRITEISKEEFPKHSIEILLEVLDDSISEALIHNLARVKRHHHPVIEQIVRRAGGNPFFIEEVVRSFIDHGALAFKDGAFEVTETIETMVIPQRINDVIMARIDRLDVRTRELIKIASVIGRSFFDQVIKDVADFIEDVDDRLAYLKDVQLIQDRIRMHELEYVFKHALMQKAVYESTLIAQRKELHLKVARSIEKLFNKKLHGFYGMLAFHYSKGDEIERAEEYMMRAGEEALRSSASSEAVQYFQKALLLCQNKYKDNAEPNKLAIFEKNIALALYNKGRWSEAVKYLDSILERLGAPLPKRGPIGILRLVQDMLILMKAVYWKLPNSKKTPEEGDIEIHELYYRAAEALGFVDNIRQFQVTLADFRRIVKFDLNKISRLYGYWAGTAAMFSVGGVSSFSLSNKLLEVSSRFRVHEDVVDRIRHSAFSCMVHHYQGTWKEILDLDWELVNSSIEAGELWHTSIYLWFSGLVRGEQGDFERLNMIIDRLFEMGEIYNYTYSGILAHSLKADYFIRRKSASEAINEAEKSIFYSRQQNSELNEMKGMAYKAMAQRVGGDEKEARETILHALEIYEKQSRMILAALVAPFLVARFLIAVEELKNAIGSGASWDVAGIRKNTYASGKAAVLTSRKYAPYRTTILRLMGEYYWLIGKQGKARKWWGKGIQEGEKLGARPDLSRTYFEVGKHLLEPNSKYKDLNGIEAKSYLKRARALFTDMDMKQDLKELDKMALD
jgi:class 3 adenylate cyclase/tetratricopeptide (TPR) repeat protein